MVHIRNLPMDVTENEILMLGLPFGKVRNVLHMKKKQQAFMELVDEGAAMSVVGYYKSVPATIRWVGSFTPHSHLTDILRCEW